MEKPLQPPKFSNKIKIVAAVISISAASYVVVVATYALLVTLSYYNQYLTGRTAGIETMAGNIIYSITGIAIAVWCLSFFAKEFIKWHRESKSKSK